MCVHCIDLSMGQGGGERGSYNSSGVGAMECITHIVVRGVGVGGASWSEDNKHSLSS